MLRQAALPKERHRANFVRNGSASCLQAFRSTRTVISTLSWMFMATPSQGNLKLKEGAAEALRECKLSGYSVMIVTEGPQDAQETTLERLGLAQYADLLVTSGRERVSKRDGLLKRALEIAACAPDELIYIGDSLVSDILPPWFSESGPFMWVRKIIFRKACKKSLRFCNCASSCPAVANSGPVAVLHARHTTRAPRVCGAFCVPTVGGITFAGAST